jgi:hypothetical protein
MTEAPKHAEISPGFADSDAAPFVYFDTAGTFGVMNGAIQIELVSRILIPLTDGGVQVRFLTTGRLRCSPTAAQHLREAINKTLDMLTQEQEGEATGPAQGTKLN